MQDWKPEQIEAFRKNHGLTRKVLGELLGVTVNCIYQWERGLREPSKTVKILLTRIADELQTKKKGR